MEEKKALTAKILIAIIVILVIAVVGLVAYILLTKNFTLVKKDTANQDSVANVADIGSNPSINNINNANTAVQPNTTDPYANYPNFAWVRTTSINAGNLNSYSAYIDGSGIIHIAYTNSGTEPTEEITVNSLTEKAKYICAQNIGFQSPGCDILITLTENNNLYIISNIYNPFITDDGKMTLNNGPDIEEVSSNILEIYNNTTNALIAGDFGGTFIGTYALTSDGKLLSINTGNYTISPNVLHICYTLGLPYEDCSSIKAIIFFNDVPLQITRDNYLRDDSNIQINYVLDSNNNKISIKYSFAIDDGTLDYGQTSLDSNCEYIITQDNKIYKVDHYNGITDYKIDLLNSKTVKDVYYDDNNKVITVTYTDNTMDRFNVGQHFNANSNKYGF
ncbi:MAG: hypothetical protein FWF46_05035 [Oscillospiraceae bacterium]|nr:hypothetical protein [Oscillospiraceae bacterium]